MIAPTAEPKERVSLKKPAIALAISVGAVVVGSAVCTPGICGCASWIGLSDPEKWGGELFMWLAIAGVAGMAINLFWLVISAVAGRVRRRV